MLHPGSASGYKELRVLVAVDFFIGRKPHDVSIKEAGIWSAVWIALAVAFGLGVLAVGGGEPAGEFFAGFITEKSLSVDNLFVFVLITAKFAVPSQHQQRVLMVGVLMALVLRAIFIAAGTAIISSFSRVFYIFGAFLIYTAWKLVEDARKDSHEEEYEENKLLKAVEQRFGVADRCHGTKLWVEENGKRVMTPMLVVMLAIGSTDVHALHESGVHVPEISIPFSLGFIVLVLAVTTVTSLWASKKRQEATDDEPTSQRL
ncbi:TerC family protein [Streptomyces sp. 11x1]|uniref:TerC family protein n=1 Tax=Streptomyces sp. 11x1 TaxID=3038642 RepID=UPI0029309164|nr:hypothetical protein [Streptomyces sp. 11x1]WNZ14829.1 hypothetical protein P8T65_45370 [Streptomyces sp. 11x1]